MAGTGIKGYTGVSSDGKYNIVNGQIVSTNPTYSSPAYTSGGSAIVNRNGAVMDTATANGFSVSDLATSIANSMANSLSGMSSGLASIGSQVANAINGAKSSASADVVNYAKEIGKIVSSSNSDYGDMIRQILANQDANTAKSQAFAREQMNYQTRSDQAAMSWSAQEAQKNRDWQEKLSDQAHQREVRDLVAAGLNPILSANQGAYTGSGATGQGFSSSGSMGNVDTSGNNALAGIMSTIMNSAVQTNIAKLYTDAERYSADLQYSSSRLATEASILNNQNTNSATRKNVLSQIEADLERTRIQGEYGIRSTELNNQGLMGRTVLEQAGANGRQVINEYGQDYRTNLSEESATHRTAMTNVSQERQTSEKVGGGSLLSAGPYSKLVKFAADATDNFDWLMKQFLGKHRGRADTNKLPSSLFKDVSWG